MMEYAMYKGEEFLDVGTAGELARKFNVSVSTIKFYATPVYRRRIEGRPNRILVVRLEDDET